jgi:hypothetical protein
VVQVDAEVEEALAQLGAGCVDGECLRGLVVDLREEKGERKKE